MLKDFHFLIISKYNDGRGCFIVGGGVDRVTSATCAEEGHWLNTGKLE